MNKYDYEKIEKKWQNYWDEHNTFHAENDYSKPKFYALVEFPYPSGQGLHIGHPRPYTAMDIVARKRRLEVDEYLHKRKYHYSPPKFLDNKSIQEKIKELLDNYLTEEKIQQYLSLDENKEKINLIKIKETLSNYYNEIFSLTNTLQDKENIIKKILDILLSENISITLFELETSKILLSLCHFFGFQFTIN